MSRFCIDDVLHLPRNPYAIFTLTILLSPVLKSPLCSLLALIASPLTCASTLSTLSNTCTECTLLPFTSSVTSTASAPGSFSSACATSAFQPSSAKLVLPGWYPKVVRMITAPGGGAVRPAHWKEAAGGSVWVVGGAASNPEPKALKSSTVGAALRWIFWASADS